MSIFQNACQFQHWGGIWSRMPEKSGFLYRSPLFVHNSIWSQKSQSHCLCYNKSFRIMFSSHFPERLLGRLSTLHWEHQSLPGHFTLLLPQLTCNIKQHPTPPQMDIPCVFLSAKKKKNLDHLLLGRETSRISCISSLSQVTFYLLKTVTGRNKASYRWPAPVVLHVHAKSETLEGLVKAKATGPGLSSCSRSWMEFPGELTLQAWGPLFTENRLWLIQKWRIRWPSLSKWLSGGAWPLGACLQGRLVSFFLSIDLKGCFCLRNCIETNLRELDKYSDTALTFRNNSATSQRYLNSYN